VHSALEGWQNFYVIVGSSAGALTGLQFVVVALVADLHDTSGFTRTSAAFATPTVVHFSVVLVLSGIFAAPWASLSTPMLVLGIAGAGGIFYTIIVARRATRQADYRPVVEDWLFHVVFPASAYATAAIAAVTSRTHAAGALFAVGGAAILLLIVGIHNAWDSVVYVVATRGGREPEQKPKPKHERGRHR
jgi:hypothetical protein